jgi:TatD DNase family protein
MFFMLIDTHCHLDFKDFDTDRDDVIDRAKASGVGKIINVASSIDGTHRSVELASKYSMIYASLGVHPHDAKTVTDKVIKDFKVLAKNKRVVAVGEVGLDYYSPVPLAPSGLGYGARNLSPKDEQISAFKKFIHLARDLNLPLIIHSRDAAREAIDMLAKENKNGVGAVMHCFAGDKDFLKECLDMGLYISFTCSLTFKNAGALRNIAGLVPTERLMLETDAPFLAPQEFRGKRNEPAYLKYLVAEWSNILHLTEDDIARITTHNANTFFGLGLDEKTRIAYEIRDSLYLNITNRCTNACDFCVRNKTEFVKGHNLKLDQEPSIEEILHAIGDPAKYKEIVFCGYGEPTVRFDIVKAVAGRVKERGVKVRLVTNGHGDLINKRPIVRELAGLVDRVSVSLNAEDEAKYNRICKPEFGAGTYKRVISFIKDCVSAGIDTEVTCVATTTSEAASGADVKRCEAAAKAMGAGFRLRKYGVVG